MATGAVAYLDSEAKAQHLRGRGPLHVAIDPLDVFFNIAATTAICTLSLHDALPISAASGPHADRRKRPVGHDQRPDFLRRSEEHTLNSSHRCISYAVFCLKKKRRFSRRSRSKARAPDPGRKQVLVSSRSS